MDSPESWPQGPARGRPHFVRRNLGRESRVSAWSEFVPRQTGELRTSRRNQPGNQRLLALVEQSSRNISFGSSEAAQIVISRAGCLSVLHPASRLHAISFFEPQRFTPP